MMEFNMEAFAHELKSQRSHCVAAGYSLLQTPHFMYIYFDIYMDDIKLTFTLWVKKSSS